MGSKVRTTTTTTTSTNIGELGFTGQAGVDLATNLALVGRQTSVDTIDAGIRSQEISAQAGEDILAAAGNFLDRSNEAALIASNTLGTVIQQQNEGFNRLVGGAGDITRSASEFREQTVGAATGLFDRITNAARGVADQASNQAQAILGSATSTIERLGPQTKANQNIAFAGLAVAAIAVGFLVLGRK